MLVAWSFESCIWLDEGVQLPAWKSWRHTQLTDWLNSSIQGHDVGAWMGNNDRLFQLGSKGIVHPKMLSWSKPEWISLFYWTESKIFWRMYFFLTMEVNGYQHSMEVNGAQNCLVTNILQNIFICVQQKKEINTCNNPTWGWVNDDWLHIFGWPIPSKVQVS